MIVDCISDLHGYFPDLPGGDLLIVAGDLTAADQEIQHLRFFEWLTQQRYNKTLFISGNHDAWMQKNRDYYDKGKVVYLCDSGTEFEGLRIWGSPWSLTFPGINPKCAAFTGTEAVLRKKYIHIPKDLDILITHTPPWGMLDLSSDGLHCGSKELLFAVLEKKPRYHIFGHIHEAHGVLKKVTDHLKKDFKPMTHINCSLVNENYKPWNSYQRIIIEKERKS